VETGSKTVTRPDRAPDVVIKPGHAVWWSEMVFMHVYGGFYQIKTDQENASLYYTNEQNDKRQELPKGMKEQYDTWWYNTFESKFLGDSND